MGRSRRTVTNGDDVGIHRLQILPRINQRLSFTHTARGNIDIDGIRAQALGRNFERRSSPGGGFLEQIDEGFATECRDLFDRSGGNFFNASGSIQNQFDFIKIKIFNSQ